VPEEDGGESQFSNTETREIKGRRKDLYAAVLEGLVGRQAAAVAPTRGFEPSNSSVGYASRKS
jgi:hypothetical protein